MQTTFNTSRIRDRDGPGTWDTLVTTSELSLDLTFLGVKENKLRQETYGLFSLIKRSKHIFSNKAKFFLALNLRRNFVCVGSCLRYTE